MHLVVANLTRGGMSGGSRKYLQRMVPLLMNHSRIDRLDVIVPPDFENSLRESTGANVSTWTDGDQRRGFRRLRDRLTADKPDVVLVPAARAFAIEGVPTVVMMRNMEPSMFPLRKNPLRESLRNLGRSWNACRACHSANHVIAVSDYVKAFLVRDWKLPEKKVTRIYHGIEPRRPKDMAVKPDAIRETATWTFFTAGSIRPARGLEDVIAAVGHLKETEINAQLWIAGSIDPGMAVYARRLRRLAAECDVADQITWLGQLSDSQMSWCFDHCTAFVMTSRAEACPNVLLESMVHGCVTASISCGPMPEFLPPQTLFYKPGNASMLSALLMRCASLSRGERARWQAASILRAADFSWQSTAQKTVSLLTFISRRAAGIAAQKRVA